MLLQLSLNVTLQGCGVSAVRTQARLRPYRPTPSVGRTRSAATRSKTRSEAVPCGCRFQEPSA